MGEGFGTPFQEQLAYNSWPMYGVGMSLIALRTYARARRVGPMKLQPDDFLMLLAGALYTLLIVCLNLIANGGSNLFEPGQLPTFTQQDIRERVKGSKIVIVSEQAMLNVIYTVKVCMLFMYSRMSLSLPKQQRKIRFLAIYVAAGWFASEMAFFLACRPFNGYWAVPPPNPQCTTLENYAIVQACFNITSDAIILLVPLPLLWHVQLPLRQKLVLIPLFSLGIFVIIAAILTKVMNLTDVYSPRYMLWYTREASVAIYVANLPMIWPLLRKWCSCTRHISPTYPQSALLQSVGQKDQRTSNVTDDRLATVERPKRFSPRRSGASDDSIFDSIGMPPLSSARLGSHVEGAYPRLEHRVIVSPPVTEDAEDLHKARPIQQPATEQTSRAGDDAKASTGREEEVAHGKCSFNGSNKEEDNR